MSAFAMASRSSLGLALSAGSALACTNVLFPGGSTVDGSTMIAYNSDDAGQFGALSHWPAADHQEGDLRYIWSWDEGVYLGAIPQPAHTYNVVGNTNEHQLSITETTFGGLKALDNSGGSPVQCSAHGCIDYGQLLWTTLARTRTAREAIGVMDHLVQTYGYASSGESISIADPHEVWLMELIGKGNYSQGAVWAATRIPDGHMCAHANQARTRSLGNGDENNFRHSADVVDFARSIGLYEGSDADFSFADVYDPITVEGARWCEARVWSLFRKFAAPEADIDSYLEYVKGFDLSNHMPLTVPVRHPVTLNDTMWCMRDTYIGTWFDSTQDVGAGEWHTPYALGHPHVWTYEGQRYSTNRNIGEPETMWNLVANQRPNHKFSVMWFGVNNPAFSVRAPFYGVTTRVPRAWDDGNCTQLDPCRSALGLPGNVSTFSFESMYWVNSLVAHYAYGRYSQVTPTVHAHMADIEESFIQQVADMDQRIQSMEGVLSDEEMAHLASEFSFNAAQSVYEQWLEFYGNLFASYADGYHRKSDPTNQVCGCSKDEAPVDELWKQEVATQTGDKYKMPPVTEVPGTTHKLNLRAFGGRRGKRCGEASSEASAAEVPVPAMLPEEPPEAPPLVVAFD